MDTHMASLKWLGLPAAIDDIIKQLVIDLQNHKNS